MTRFTQNITASTFTDRGPIRMDRFHAIVLGVILLICTVAVIGLAFGSGTEPQQSGTQTTGAVTDGWMTSITYTNQERADERARMTVDGWSTALLKPEPPVVDGWAASLLKPEPRVVDGWATRYLVSDD